MKEHEIRGTTMPAGLYWWCRDKDETGMSGTGRVAQVAIFRDGCACLRWLKDMNSAGVSSTVSYDTIGDLLWVHGHGLAQTGHLEPDTPGVKDLCDLSAAFRLDIKQMKRGHAQNLAAKDEGWTDMTARVDRAEAEVKRLVSQLQHGLSIETRYARQRNEADVRADKAEAELKRVRKLHPSSLDGLAWDAPGMQAPGRPGPDD